MRGQTGCKLPDFPIASATGRLLLCRGPFLMGKAQVHFSVAGSGIILQENTNLTGPLAPLPEKPSRHTRESLMPIFWRQRWVIAACGVLALGAAVAYLLTATKVYTSTARIKVTPAASRLTGEIQSFTDATAGNYLYTERDVIASPSVLALAAQVPEVKRLLADDPDPLTYLDDNLGVDVDKRGAILLVS